MEIYFYNTLTKKKERFNSIDLKTVRMYSCGPTVYYYAHIGNLRAYLLMDSLRRVLKYNGYSLKHVMNITDVGHLVSDADEGEDKMLKASKRENKDPFAIADFYMEAFLKDLKKLNVDTPEIIARATKHIECMEKYVKKIIENGYTYETENTIYFDTSKLDKYGLLSNKDVNEDDLESRINVDPNKKHPNDFALWIKAPENHLMKWDTFWGKCYPGWHLECSAMGHEYLGEEFDIHTGGVDHIPVHHENEIAQAKGYCGKIPAHFWMHCEFLQVNGGKMSKSLGNVYTLSDLEEKGYEPAVFRMFNFGAHYRKKINFTFEAMDAAKISLERLREAYKKHEQGINNIDIKEISIYEEQFNKAINDDLNIPAALSVVWDVAKQNDKSKDYAELLKKFDTVLGLEIDKINEIEIPKEVNDLIELRKISRINKDWAESDRLREKIKGYGYYIKDTKDGIEVEKI